MTFFPSYYNLNIDKNIVKKIYNLTKGRKEKYDRRILQSNRRRLFKFFLMDESYNQLKTAIEANDCESAFRGAHTLKGVCQNMAFENLSKIVEQITEELRAKEFEKALATFPNVAEEYQKVIDGINEII